MSAPIKVLTLHQPYATLIALGVKTVETRGQAFRSLVGQRIAIHAAARPPEPGLVGDWLINGSTMVPADIDDREYSALRAEALPLGAILGTALVDEEGAVRDPWCVR